MCEQQEGKPKWKNLKIRKNELACTSSTKTKTKQKVILRKLRVKCAEEAPGLDKKNNKEEDNIK